MKQFIITSFAAISVARGAAQIDPAPLLFQSGENQTALIELYTSEGCSSCPPAGAWLSQLKATPRLWKDYVPVAFHVDYWDDLGWRDRWGAKKFTARQRAYAELWGGRTIYTPEFVVNGAEWDNDDSRKGLPKPTDKKAGVLTVSSEGTNRWQVSFVPATSLQSSFDVYAALLASGLSSDVKAGENRGRRLDHDFVVLELAKGPLSKREGVFRSEFVLSSKQKPTAGRMGIAVWVAPRNRLEPLQTVGGWLGK